MVVTIVVLLILAGISISLVVGDNGLIRKSKDAKKQYEEAQANELAMTDEAGDLIDETVTGVAKPVKVPVGTKASKNGTIDGKEGNANNPTIPKNYTPIDAGEATWGDGTSSPTQNAVDHGLVIKDDSGNEWVWIPVDSTTLGKMVETSTEAKTLCGTTGETAVTTNKYSKTITIGKDSNTATLSRTTPGISTSGSYREPDLVVGNDGTSYDAKDTYYKTILGETGTKEQLAKLFVAEYNEMITSISKYGGFYIGRYELSGTVTDPTEKSGVTLTKTNWYNLYNACRSSKLQASDKVKTQMIWGIQWDVACNFIANKGDQKNIKDSSAWGNYKNTSVKADDGTTELKASGTEAKLNTGKTTFTMANNIYDLAGNCFEWTQEASSTVFRAVRGGKYSDDGSRIPASGRNYGNPTATSYGSRPTLIIKP
mgnify:CR=1 FL=1